MNTTPNPRTFWRRLWLALALLAVAAQAKDTAYLGEARDETGNLVYTERHTVRSGEQGILDSLTEYLAPDGTLIATLRSDYSRSVALPTYIFEDLRRGYREGLRWQDGRYVVFHQSGSAPEKAAPLRRDHEVFSCQGWHYYLIDNLDLLEKENIALNLVLPSELGPFPFAVRKLAADATRVSAELKFKHWLFRYFAPKMRLEYDRENRRLREFHGVSNILSQSGERQTVTIRYTYADNCPRQRRRHRVPRNCPSRPPGNLHHSSVPPFPAMKLLPFLPCLLLLTGCATSLPALKTVEKVDLERFMGPWYVIAAIPTFIETEAFNAIEDYRLEADGTIATTFTFNQGAFDGPPKRYTPRGFVVDRVNNSTWAMQFVWPFKAEFLITHLDPEYTRTVIGRNKRDYVWVMARTPQIPEADYQQLVADLAEQGYEVAKLRRVPQQWPAPR